MATLFVPRPPNVALGRGAAASVTLFVPAGPAQPEIGSAMSMLPNVTEPAERCGV
jgi:hypothetical protein